MQKKRSSLRIAVLGGGPGAAYSYRAALDFGIPAENIEVYTNRFHIPAGAFWLYDLPKGIKGISSHIYVLRLGTAEEYSRKQWGTVYPSSFDRMSSMEFGYNPRIYLPLMWEGAKPTHLNSLLTDQDTEDLAKVYDLTVQTFPTDLDKALYRIKKQEPVRFPIWIGDFPTHQNVVYYSGDLSSPWVRTTYAWGWRCVEYPAGTTEEQIQEYEQRIHQVPGVVRSFFDLHPETEPLMREERFDEDHQILLVGRLATWDRTELSNAAYTDVLKKLEELYGN